MPDDLKIVFGVDVDETTRNLTTQLTQIASQITPEITVAVNLDKTKELMQRQLQSIARELGAGIGTIVNDAMSTGPQKTLTPTVDTFDIVKLKEQEMAFVKIAGNIERITAAAKNQLASIGNVQTVQGIQSAEGAITGFTAEIQRADGVLQQFNFTKAKLSEGGGRATSGFVQVEAFEAEAGKMEAISSRLVQMYSKLEIARDKALGKAMNTVAVDEINAAFAEGTQAVQKFEQEITSSTSKSDQEFKDLAISIDQTATKLNNLSKIKFDISVKQIESQFTKLDTEQARLNPMLESDIEQVRKSAEELNARLGEVRQTLSTIDATSGTKQMYDDFKQAESAIGLVKSSISELSRVKVDTTFEDKIARDVTSANQRVGVLIASYSQLENVTMKVSQRQSELNAIIQQLAGARTEDERIQALAKLQTVIRQTSQEYKQMLPPNVAAAENQIARMEQWLNNNARAAKAYGGELSVLIERMRQVGTQEQFGQIKSEFDILTKRASGLGLTTDTLSGKLTSMFAKFSQWFGITRVIMELVNAFKQMITNVTELDSAMTELRKVTDETDETYTRFLEGATERARRLGATITDVIRATSDFSKMGFELAEASTLADSAILMQNVADGITDVSEASGDIISTLKAFSLEASSATRIVDVFNEVSNRFAVDARDLGAGVKDAGAAFAVAGNDFNQTVALLTATDEVMQNMSKSSTALRTVAARLRNTAETLSTMGEETDFAAESITKLQYQMRQLTGVDIMLDADTFRSTYDILKDISLVWDEITDVQQADVLRLIGGKLAPYVHKCA